MEHRQLGVAVTVAARSDGSVSPPAQHADRARDREAFLCRHEPQWGSVAADELERLKSCHDVGSAAAVAVSAWIKHALFRTIEFASSRVFTNKLRNDQGG